MDRINLGAPIRPRHLVPTQQEVGTLAPNDLTPCRMAFYFVSTFAIAQTPTKQPALRLSRSYRSENKKSSLLLRLCFYNFQQLNSYGLSMRKGRKYDLTEGRNIGLRLLNGYVSREEPCTDPYARCCGQGWPFILSPPSLSLRLRQNNRPYGYRGLKIFTSLKLRFQDFQRP
jgi:hypothetical protein